MARPVITFVSDVSEIALGGSVVLDWSVEGADSITIDDIGADPSGTLTVEPTSTKAYILLAENVDGQSVAIITITVNIPDVLVPVFNTEWSVVWGGSSTSSQVKCKVGENFPIQMTVKDSAGVDMDLSQYSARYALKKRQSALTTDYIIEPMDLDISGGSVTGNISAVISSDITPGNYVEEIELYTSSGDYVKKFGRQRVIESSVIVSTFGNDGPPPVQ
jgi:hypothetical protein